MVKMKRVVPKAKPAPRKIAVCLGCGNEYDPRVGDAEAEVKIGTSFQELPESWMCPHCGEGKSRFIEIEV